MAVDGENIFLGHSVSQCNNTALPIGKLASRPGALPGGLDFDVAANGDIVADHHK